MKEDQGNKLQKMSFTKGVLGVQGVLQKTDTIKISGFHMKKGATKPLNLQPKRSAEMFCINFNFSLYRSSKFELLKKMS